VATYRNQYASAPAGGVSNGNEHEVAGYEGLSYTFIGDRQLASIIGNGSSYALVYDALGRCVKRTLNGTTIYYTYDGPHPIYEWKADGTKAGWNLYGRAIDEILLRGDFQVLSNGQGYFFQQNRLGSVTHLTGFAGEIIESYRCDAFGQPTTSYTGGSFNNRFKFTGREYQEAFGIYEYRNRAYHPGLGRFLSEDPIGSATGDTNLFRYCGNDPVNCTDPSGLWQVTIFAGHGFGGVFTFGSNSGQWNSGVFMGAGEGAFINVNLKEQAAVPPNGGGAVLATAGAGAVAAGLRMTVYVGHDENYATGSGRLGPASDGLKWDGKSWTNTGGSITLGGGVFIGAGVTAHEPIESTKIPAPGGSTFVDPNDCAAPDCATTERVTVTATYLNLGPYLELGTTYWDSNGNPFHAGTTGNIINGQAFTVSNWFPSLTSSGGGDWQTAGYFPSGGEPGEGSWASLVSPEKY
jgi:RHS repeat-associated protein